MSREGLPGGALSAVLFGLLVVLPVALSAPAAAADPGQIDHADLSTSSRFQGLGGPVTVSARLYVASDPHRTLFVTNLKVELSAQDGFTVDEGENPVMRDSLEVPATAGFFVATFSWTLTASRVGDFTLVANVTSASSGGARAEANVTVREGVVLGRTLLQPLRPTTADTLVFTVPSSSGFDDPNVTVNVTLYVFQSVATVRPVSATGAVVRLWTPENVPRNELGTALRMAGSNGTYSYAIPPLSRGTLIYWVFAETAYSNVTSAPTRVFVEDPGTTAAVQWVALAAVASLVAAGVYIVLYDPFGQRPASGSIHNSPDRMRFSLVLLAIGTALVAVAVLAGAATGLWRWFGYL